MATPDVKPQPAVLKPHEGRVLKAREIGINAQGNAALKASHCKDCDLKVFPPADVCPDCLSANQQALHLGRSGKLYSYTQIHVAPPAWTVPYVIGYVDMPEGVRLFGKVQADRIDALKMDMPVEVRIDESAGQHRYFFLPQV